MNSWQISTPQYFNFSEVLWFLDRGYDDCLHEVNTSTIRKLLWIEDQPCLIQISDQRENLWIEVLNKIQPQYHKQISHYVRDWFDLDRDLGSFYEQIAKVPALYKRISMHQGLRLIGIHDLFEALSWSIIGQQINLTFAYRLKRRLVEQYGNSFQFEGITYYSFPSPQKIATCEIHELKAMQFSTRKAEYLIGIAQLLVDGIITKSQLADLEHTAAMVATLCKIRGVGEWTANYTLMKCLKRMDSIPYGDAGLLKAIQLVQQSESRPSREEIDLFFYPLSGWEAYTTFYLWQSLSK